MPDRDEPDEPDDDASDAGPDVVPDPSEWQWGTPSGDEADPDADGDDGDPDADGDDGDPDADGDDGSENGAEGSQTDGADGDDRVRRSLGGDEDAGPVGGEEPPAVDGPIGDEDTLTVPTDADPGIVPDEWWGAGEGDADRIRRKTAAGDDEGDGDGDEAVDAQETRIVTGDDGGESDDGTDATDDGSDGDDDGGEGDEAVDAQETRIVTGDDADGDGADDGDADEADGDGGGATGSEDADDDASDDESDDKPNPTRGKLESGEDSSALDDFAGETAPDDEEMPLTEHVEEMALRFMAVGLVMVGIGAITLFYADELINFLWYSFIGPGLGACPDPSTCPDQYRPKVYHPLALVLARIKVGTLVGLIGALPIAVYQTYRFMRPGLYPRERRYYLAAVPTSLVLAAGGVAMAYFAVLPALFDYFTTYSEEAAVLAFGLTETFNLIVLMLGFFALIFQIPLLVMLAIMMGVTTRRWLQDRRLYFWAGFAAIAFVFSPDPTGMAPLIVAVTMIALFDGTLLLLKWTTEGSLVPSAAGVAEKRPYAWGVAGVIGYLVSTAPAPAGYYDLFPTVLRDFLASAGVAGYVPFVVAGLLIGLYELATVYVGSTGRVRLRLRMLDWRRVAWVVAVVIGYLGSPEPPLLATVTGVGLDPAGSIAVAFGVITLYELSIVVLERVE